MTTKLIESMKKKLTDAGCEIEITERNTWHLYDKEHKMDADYSRGAHTEEEFLVNCIIILAKINKNVHVSHNEKILYNIYHSI